jgi:serine/threonine protein kinase
MDATRLSDGKTVAIKCISKSSAGDNEIAITQFFSSKDLAEHPDNHCIPLLDVFENPEEPDHYFIVEPWMTYFNEPEFVNVMEVVDFLAQTLQVGVELKCWSEVILNRCLGFGIHASAWCGSQV